MSMTERILKAGTQKIVKPLDLSTYHESYEGMILNVWVNITPAVREEYSSLQRRLRGLKKIFVQTLKDIQDREDKGEEVDVGAEIEVIRERIEALNQEVWAWYATVWEGETKEKVEELARNLNDPEEGDPAMWEWMQNKTWSLITMKLEGFEKN